MPQYHRPTSLDQALTLLAEGGFTVLAGGTDVMVQRDATRRIIDITALPGLRRIERLGSGWRIPCLATWSDILAPGLPPEWDALRQAVGQIGGRQIQNAGTLIGNLCNASPAADGVPCLLAMDAAVEIASTSGARLIPVRDFVLGPRSTALAPGELALALHVPDHGGISRFEKLGARSHLVISIAMVAVWLRLERGVIAEARIAIGACGPKAILLPELAQGLVGQNCATAAVAPEPFQALSAIDDIRAPAWYRRHAARVLVERAIHAMARQDDLAA
eukprot:gene5962-6034_t